MLASGRPAPGLSHDLDHSTLSSTPNIYPQQLDPASPLGGGGDSSNSSDALGGISSGRLEAVFGCSEYRVISGCVQINIYQSCYRLHIIKLFFNFPNPNSLSRQVRIKNLWNPLPYSSYVILKEQNCTKFWPSKFKISLTIHALSKMITPFDYSFIYGVLL